MIGFRQLLERVRNKKDYESLTNHYNQVNKLNDELTNHYTYNNEKHHHSLDKYSGKEYRIINGHLWNVHNKSENLLTATDRTNAEHHIKNIDEAMNVHKTPKSFSVYSSIRHNFNPEENKVYHHPSFLSTSLSRGTAKFFEKPNVIHKDTGAEFHHHMLHIHVPKDHPGAFLESVSPGEKEFILPRGTNLRHKHTHTYLKKGNSPEEKDAYYHVHHMDIVK